MPAKSKAQFRFMKAVEGGYIHPKGLSEEKAKEFTQGATKQSFSKLKEYMTKKKKKD